MVATNELTLASARELFIAKLAESGLTPNDAAKLHIDLLTPKQTSNLSPNFFESWAIKLPYHDIKGKVNGFYRIRYIGDPRPAVGFAAHTVSKIPRYVQPPDTEPSVYVPPIGDRSWKDIIHDPVVPIFITEGEFKAACATLKGFPTLGLGGVWSWKSTKKGVDLVHLLKDEIDWEGRPVYIVFDSDTATNPQVSMALNALCAKLTERGAYPYTIKLPDLDHLDKTGLDDYLVSLRTPGPFLELIEQAQVYSEARALWDMNKEVIYVRDPGVIVAKDLNLIMRPNDFVNHQYSDRSYPLLSVSPAGIPKVETKYTAREWLKWQFRNVVTRFTYKPGQPELTEENEYNQWKGWGCAPKKGDVTLWKELLDFLFASEPKARIWFERWCAYPIQHPGTKLYTAAVIWGTMTGTGKSLVGYSLMRIYGQNSNEINDQHLQSDFNEWAVNQQFIMGDDVVSGENKRHIADRLKALITQQEMRINKKFLPSYVTPDCINYYFTSNHPDAFFIEDADRRYFIHEAPRDRMTTEFYRKYDKWYKSEAGASALHYHLLHLNLGDFDPMSEAQETIAKRDMIIDNKTDLAAWVHELKQNPDGLLKAAGARLDSDLLTNKQLLAVFDPESRTRVSQNVLGRELKRAGFTRAWDGPVMTKSGPQRLWIIRNKERWSKNIKISEISAYWDSKFGKFDTSSSGAKY